MTDRKPPGVTWESWIDRQIREAWERGEFDNLPGAGKPIPGIDQPYDEMWWVKKKLASEEASFLPPALALRKEVDEVLGRIMHERSEDSVRSMLLDINARISHVNRSTVSGPSTMISTFDVEQMVQKWRDAEDRRDQETS